VELKDFQEKNLRQKEKHIYLEFRNGVQGLLKLMVVGKL